jgi:hypothetical protein
MAVDASSIGVQAQVAFFGRSHDSTPIRVAFGQLGDLASAARYWHKDKITGSSSLLTLDEYSSIYTKLPSFGIVEMLAQKGVVAWPVEQDGDFIAVERRNLFFQPTFLERCNASTIYRALDVASPLIALRRIIEMSITVTGFIVIFIGSDLASSCGRLKMEYARITADHNRFAVRDGRAVILLVDGPCCAHILHREVEKSFGLHRLIPKLYNTAWSCSLPGVFQAVHSALKRVVGEDLAVNFFPGVAPPEEMQTGAQSSRLLLEMCLLRIKFVRAQHEDQDYVNPELQALYDEFVNFFNGDLRRPVVQHYCHMPGCCEGHQRKVAVTRCVGLLSAALFSSIGVDLPAENRWYTFGPHLARQCSGMLTHRILGRVVALAFTASVEANDETSYHATANKRKAASIEYLVDNAAEASGELGLATIAVAPLDRLSHRLQHLDHKGGSMQELVDISEHGCLIAAQKEYRVCPLGNVSCAHGSGEVILFVSPFSGSVGRCPTQGGHCVGSYPTFMTRSGGLAPTM